MNLIELVKDYDVITIFRHQIADQDAYGSQFGLKFFFEGVFPNKEVYALGKDESSCSHLFPELDNVGDEVVKRSIAIVLDTADFDRIDDKRYKSAKKTVKIDHHIIVEEYADESYVNTKAAATCEILAFLIQQTGKKVSEQCARYLYYGISADSLGFTTNNTTADTLLAASFLIRCGVDVNAVKQSVSGISEKEFLYVNEIRYRMKRKGNVVYSIMNDCDFRKFGLDYVKAKEKVFALANVNEYKVWCLFTEDLSYGDTKLYNASLRSQKLAINEVSNQYGGGGHKNACGIKKLTLDDIENLVNDLNDLF